MVLGQRLDEGLLRAVDALPLEPHAREDSNPLFCGLIADWLAAEGRGLEQLVDPLLDEVIPLVVDVGGAEVGVVGERVDADDPVVFVGDVLAEVGERGLVGAAIAIALGEAVVPLRGERGAGAKEELAVDFHLVAG